MEVESGITFYCLSEMKFMEQYSWEGRKSKKVLSKKIT